LRSAPRTNTRRGHRLFPAAQSCAKDCCANAAGDRGVIFPVRPCKKNCFRLLFRHATSDFLLCWFIAECSSCVGADAKTRITITVTEPNAARGSTSAGRNRAKFAHQHDRHRRTYQEGSKGSRRNVFLSRRADWPDRY